MSITVLQPGLLTTVQDLGRYGYQNMGIPVSGVMDPTAYRQANALVGNCSGEAVLELTLMGGRYRFDCPALAALTGADMSPRVNGNPVPMYHPFALKAGDVLELGPALRGCRSYLAVAGGFSVPVVMGSRSTCRKIAVGGLEGRTLRAGDVLPLGVASSPPDPVPEYPVPLFSSEITVRVIPGPQADYFTEKGFSDFFRSPYTVTQQSDRMGIRLDGPAIESKNGTDIVSDGIVFGSIQVTGSGMPIVLMADRQTTGGYAKIATVCTADLSLLAQAVPGTKVRFTQYSEGESL